MTDPITAPETERDADLADDPVWQSFLRAPPGLAQFDEQRQWSEDAELEERALSPAGPGQPADGGCAMSLLGEKGGARKTASTPAGPIDLALAFESVLKDAALGPRIEGLRVSTLGEVFRPMARHFGAARRWSIHELATCTSLSPPTVRRMIRALVDLGVTKFCRPGPRYKTFCEVVPLSGWPTSLRAAAARASGTGKDDA